MNLFKTKENSSIEHQNYIHFIRMSETKVKAIQIADNGVYQDILNMSIDTDFILRKNDFDKVFSIMSNPDIKNVDNKIIFSNGKKEIKLSKISFEMPHFAEMDKDNFVPLPMNFINIIKEASKFTTSDYNNEFSYIYLKDKFLTATNGGSAFMTEFDIQDIGEAIFRKDTFDNFKEATQFKIQGRDLFLANDDFSKVAKIIMGDFQHKPVKTIIDNGFDGAEEIECDLSELTKQINIAIKLGHTKIELSKNKILGKSDAIEYVDEIKFNVDKKILVNLILFKEMITEGKLMIKEFNGYPLLMIEAESDKRVLLPLRS